MICHSNKCHRPRTSSCHKEQQSRVDRVSVLELSRVWADLGGGGEVYTAVGGTVGGGFRVQGF